MSKIQVKSLDELAEFRGQAVKIEIDGNSECVRLGIHLGNYNGESCLIADQEISNKVHSRYTITEISFFKSKVYIQPINPNGTQFSYSD